MTTPPWGNLQAVPLSLPSSSKGRLAVSDDGAWLVWVHSAGQLGVLEVATGAESNFASSGGYGSDDEMLGEDGGVFLQWGAIKKAKPKIWRRAKAKYASRTPDLGLTGRVTAGVLLPGGGFACGDVANTVAIADPKNNVVASLRVPSAAPASILWLGAVRVDGVDELLVVGGDNGVANRGGALHRYALDGTHRHDYGLFCCGKAYALSDDGARLAVGYAVGQTLELIDVRSGAVTQIDLPLADVRGLRFSADGTRLVVGLSDGWTWGVFDLATKTLVGKGPHLYYRGAARLHPNGRWVLHVTQDARGLALRAVDLETGADHLVRELAPDSHPQGFATNRRGDVALAVAPRDAQETWTLWLATRR